MPSHQPLPLPTLSDVMEDVLARMGPDLARRGHRMIVDLVDSSTDTARDLFAVADVIADVLDCASLYSLTKRNLVHVAFEDDHVLITVRDEIRDSGWPLARRLTETHGSRISCCSAEIERGTEVIVRLPVPAPKRGGPREFRYRATVARPLLKVRAVQDVPTRAPPT